MILKQKEMAKQLELFKCSHSILTNWPPWRPKPYEKGDLSRMACVECWAVRFVSGDWSFENAARKEIDEFNMLYKRRVSYNG